MKQKTGKFNIAKYDCYGEKLVEKIEGTLINIAGFKCFIHKEKEYDIFTKKMTINISEFETGILCSKGKTNKKDAIEWARIKLTKYPHKVEEGKTAFIKKRLQITD